MNTIYKLALLGIVASFALPVNLSAQTAKNDTILNRQVNLEREYTPSIQDATKVSSVPSVYQPQKKQYNIKFVETTPTVDIRSFKVSDTGSGDIQTQIDYSRYRGYLSLGGGFYSNLEGTLGYRIIDLSNDQLDIFATHSSTNARIKYAENDSPLDKVKAKDMVNFVKLKYKHTFKPLVWSFEGSLLNDAYNYYGNPYAVAVAPVFSIDNLEKKQSFNIIELETSVKSNETDRYFYTGNVRYNRFSLKYGPDFAYDGVSANLIDANVNIFYPIKDVFKFGVKGGIFYQGTGDVKFADTSLNDPFHSLTLFKANPYIGLNGDDFKIFVGVNFNQAFDAKDKTVLSPYANIWWNFQDESVFYLNLEGGINSNSLVDIYNQNKYVDTSKRIDVSKKPYDLQVGVRSGIVDGLEFDIFGGYKYVKEEHFYVQVPTASGLNVSDVLYGDLGTGHLGGLLKTKLIPYTDLSLKAVGYFYNLKNYNNTSLQLDDKKAWGMPSVTVDFNADFSFVDNFILTASYQFEGGSKTYANGSSINMKAVNELNLKANYSILDWLSVYGKATNILNQKYERYYGYTLQGLSIVGGVNFKF